jgi:Ca2+-binding EF-hand superfamily protein
MFEELAQSNVEGLSLALLRDLAMRVDFNVSAEKMRNVFHAIDKDQTGRIMYQEMFQVHIHCYTANLFALVVTFECLLTVW